MNGNCSCFGDQPLVSQTPSIMSTAKEKCLNVSRHSFSEPQKDPIMAPLSSKKKKLEGVVVQVS